MKFQYKLMLWKKYIDRGRGITSYANEIFLILGTWQIATYKSPMWIIIMILAYGVMCFIVGWFWFKYKWEIYEKEVENQFNFFQQELRAKLGIKRKI